MCCSLVRIQQHIEQRRAAPNHRLLHHPINAGSTTLLTQALERLCHRRISDADAGGAKCREPVNDLSTCR